MRTVESFVQEWLPKAEDQQVGGSEKIWDRRNSLLQEVLSAKMDRVALMIYTIGVCQRLHELGHNCALGNIAWRLTNISDVMRLSTWSREAS